MRSSKQRLSMLGVLILTGMVTLAGCANKKFVRSEVGSARTQLDARINDTNAKVAEADERIDGVDHRAQQGIQAADQRAAQAQQAAAVADQKAMVADQKAMNAQRTAVGMDKYTAGPPTTVTFKTGSAVLSDEAQKTLDDVANQVSNMDSGYQVEILGSTDSTGSTTYNYQLSERRAEAVRRYLVGKKVQLYRISIVGEGDNNPIANNKTKKGREQNRRVEVRILKNAVAAVPTN
jgi:outer membrane protein OmpA-like peptidoglycan-associated protein